MSIRSPRAAKIIQEYRKKPGIVPAIQEYKKNPAHGTGDIRIRDSCEAIAQDSRYKWRFHLEGPRIWTRWHEQLRNRIIRH
jgi:hypothetical protein